MITPLLFTLFALSGVLANYAVDTYGIVPIGFGLMAPAGVFVVGVALTLRDMLHEVGGVRLTLGAIVLGSLLSASFAPGLALASGLAFLVSELADLAVYTPLRENHLTAALLASNVVGLVVDSILFLLLAFGSLQFLTGQIVGKTMMTLVAVLAITVVRRSGLLARSA